MNKLFKTPPQSTSKKDYNTTFLLIKNILKRMLISGTTPKQLISNTLYDIMDKISTLMIKIERGIDSKRSGYSIFDTREGYPY